MVSVIPPVLQGLRYHIIFLLPRDSIPSLTIIRFESSSFYGTMLANSFLNKELKTMPLQVFLLISYRQRRMGNIEPAAKFPHTSNYTTDRNKRPPTLCF